MKSDIEQILDNLMVVNSIPQDVFITSQEGLDKNKSLFKELCEEITEDKYVEQYRRDTVIQIIFSPKAFDMINTDNFDDLKDYFIAYDQMLNHFIEKRNRAADALLSDLRSYEWIDLIQRDTDIECILESLRLNSAFNKKYKTVLEKKKKAIYKNCGYTHL